jgi:CRP-like cAMP-binding protein
LFVVLEGTLVVRRGDRVVMVASRGDVLGEIAFLINARRTADVIAAHDGVRVLALSEANLSILISTEPELAAKLLLNLSRALCYKIATSVPEA